MHPDKSDYKRAAMSNGVAAEIQRVMTLLKGLPEPIAYIVLDHSWSMELPYADGHDADGRRYILTSPAVLDEMQHRKWQGLSILSSPTEVTAHLAAIPVYRREHLHEGWPEEARP